MTAACALLLGSACSEGDALAVEPVPRPALGKADGAGATLYAPDAFFLIRLDEWPKDKVSAAALESEVSSSNARLRVFRLDPDASRERMAESGTRPGESESQANARWLSTPCEEPDDDDALLHTATGDDVALRISGNMTKWAPKSSYKIKLAKNAAFDEQRTLNLKSMWNDVSQMREALAWHMFAQAGVHAPRHAYARFCINGRYRGLYSVIEQVDKTFLERRFGKNDKGNLYKADWADIGPADLQHRASESGDDSGARYFSASDIDARTYQLKTNDKSDDDAAHKSYDDLAAFVRVVNGMASCNASGCKTHDAAYFDSDAYRSAVEDVFDVYTFLRWAGLSLLMGAWDNYWGTPSNYYLYNSGKQGAAKDFMATPYFHFVPWDYDNTFGIDFFDIPWHHADLLNWESITMGRAPDGGAQSLPLVTRLLSNTHFRRYYLDHIEHLVGSSFAPNVAKELLGDAGSGGFWDLVRTSAYFESRSSTGAPLTGRRFTNEQIYWNGYRDHEWPQPRVSGQQFILGIEHHVRMRRDRAEEQLELLRARDAAGASGATFPAQPGPLPAN